MREHPTDQPQAYEPPSVVEREAIIALLGTPDGVSPSDANPPPSDVNVKENIRPVRW